jgi:predicted phosphate transport protein (TIGR00153 family)
MSVLSKLFTPAGKKFYELFEQVAVNLEAMAGLFSQHLHVDDRKTRKPLLDKIEMLEHKNDEVTHKLFVELGRNFITPFDREDIHFISSSLDDIADYMWGTAKQVYYFDINLQSTVSGEVAGRLINYIKLLGEIIQGLSDRKGLHSQVEILEQMRELAGTSDTIITKAITGLFDNETSTVDMIKLSDHYNMLLKLNNKCGDVINVLEAMIIKYA